MCIMEPNSCLQTWILHTVQLQFSLSNTVLACFILVSTHVGGNPKQASNLERPGLNTTMLKSGLKILTWNICVCLWEESEVYNAHKHTHTHTISVMNLTIYHCSNSLDYQGTFVNHIYSICCADIPGWFLAGNLIHSLSATKLNSVYPPTVISETLQIIQFYMIVLSQTHGFQIANILHTLWFAYWGTNQLC